MPTRITPAVPPRTDGEPVSRLMRLVVAHFGQSLHSAFVAPHDADQDAWWKRSRRGPLRRRPGSDLARAAVLLGELLLEQEQLADAGLLKDTVAWLRYECSRYEQFDDADTARAGEVIATCVSLLGSLGRASTAIERAWKLLTALERRSGSWTRGQLDKLAELERLAPRAAPVAPVKDRSRPKVAVEGPKPGDAIDGVPVGDRARVTVMGEIVQLRTERSLEDARGRSINVDVLRRLRRVRPSGRVWVDERGVVTTCLGDTTVYVDTLAAEEWFPGVITKPLKSCPTSTKTRSASAADVRKWARQQGFFVARTGLPGPAVVEQYNAAHPTSPYAPVHPVTVTRVAARR
ncbi:hypothetical protein GTQ99_01100 [Kineococcus sp. T13]|uniref:hypothetical protein n=1 Tax=Kineococcus vitellinus TaxID=2696565 RepID=UPI0014122933|nr:hypothetical protein [Kineococcus vitellinus]NAZ74029.1 hypothetical protein [Kineococcus vitellinus]